MLKDLQYKNLIILYINYENYNFQNFYENYCLNLEFEKYFKSYDFHNLYKELLNFCTVDLSAFYFDIRKDCLYCDSKDSDKRKSSLTLLNVILNSLLRWFAPILSFTTEEIYQLVSKKK